MRQLLLDWLNIPSDREQCRFLEAHQELLSPKSVHVLKRYLARKAKQAEIPQRTLTAPYLLRDGNWDNERDKFADRCFEIMEQYAPGFRRSVINRQVLTPVDLERVYGLTGGNIFQGSMSLSKLFFLRPAIGFADYRTPIRGLYLCGSAAHPGGGVIGAAGRNAAREIKKDWRRLKST